MRLYIIGAGINGISQITPETTRILKHCHSIFVLNPYTKVLDFVRKTNPSAKVIDCSCYYDGVEKRPEVYQRISNDIIKECKQHPYASIAFLTYGHPLFLVSASEKMVEASRLEGIAVKVYPAVTSLDTVIADLQIEIGYCFSVFDATLVIKNNVKLDTSIPVFIFQMANLFDDSVQKDWISYEKLTPLRDHLLKYYNPEHEITLIVSSHDTLFDPLINRVKMKDLCECDFPSLKDRPTLFIPEHQ